MAHVFNDYVTFLVSSPHYLQPVGSTETLARTLSKDRLKSFLLIGRDEIMEPQRMKQTIREDTDSEIIIQTLREVPLYK